MYLRLALVLLLQCVSLESLNWLGWFGFGRKPIFAATPAASKNTTRFKSGQKWLKNNHLTIFVYIPDTLRVKCLITGLPLKLAKKTYLKTKSNLLKYCTLWVRTYSLHEFIEWSIQIQRLLVLALMLNKFKPGICFFVPNLCYLRKKCLSSREHKDKHSKLRRDPKSRNMRDDLI